MMRGGREKSSIETVVPENKNKNYVSKREREKTKSGEEEALKSEVKVVSFNYFFSFNYSV